MRREEDISYELRASAYRHAGQRSPATTASPGSQSLSSSPVRTRGKETLRASRLPVPSRLRRCSSSGNLMDTDRASKAECERKSSTDQTRIYHRSQGSRSRPSSASAAERRGLFRKSPLTKSPELLDCSRIPRLRSPSPDVRVPLSASRCSPPTPTDRLRQRLLSSSSHDSTLKARPLGLCTSAAVGSKMVLTKTSSVPHSVGTPVRGREVRMRSLSVETSDSSSSGCSPMVSKSRSANSIIPSTNHKLRKEVEMPQPEEIPRMQYSEGAKNRQLSLGLNSGQGDVSSQLDSVHRVGCAISLFIDASKADNHDVTGITGNADSSTSNDSGFHSVKGTSVDVSTEANESARPPSCRRSLWKHSSASTESSIFSSLDDNDSIFWQDNNTNRPELNSTSTTPRAPPPVRRSTSQPLISRSSFTEATEDLEELISKLRNEALDGSTKNHSSHSSLRQTRTPYSREQMATPRHLARQKSHAKVALRRSSGEEQAVIEVSHDTEINGIMPATPTPVKNGGVLPVRETNVDRESGGLSSPFASRLPRLQKSSYFKLKAATAIREIRASDSSPGVDQRILEDKNLVVMDAEEHRRMVQELKLLKTMLLKLKRQLMNNKEDGITVLQEVRHSSDKEEASHLRHTLATPKQTLETLHGNLMRYKRNDRHKQEVQ